MVSIMLNVCIKTTNTLAGTTLDVSITTKYSTSCTDLMNDLDLHHKFLNLVTSINQNVFVFEYHNMRIHVCRANCGGGNSIAITYKDTDNYVSNVLYCDMVNIYVKDNMSTDIDCIFFMDGMQCHAGRFVLGELI